MSSFLIIYARALYNVIHLVELRNLIYSKDWEGQLWKFPTLTRKMVLKIAKTRNLTMLLWFYFFFREITTSDILQEHKSNTDR